MPKAKHSRLKLNWDIMFILALLSTPYSQHTLHIRSRFYSDADIKCKIEYRLWKNFWKIFTSFCLAFSMVVTFVSFRLLCSALPFIVIQKLFRCARNLFEVIFTDIVITAGCFGTIPPSRNASKILNANTLQLIYFAVQTHIKYVDFSSGFSFFAYQYGINGMRVVHRITLSGASTFCLRFRFCSNAT